MKNEMPRRNVKTKKGKSERTAYTIEKMKWRFSGKLQADPEIRLHGKLGNMTRSGTVFFPALDQLMRKM